MICHFQNQCRAEADRGSVTVRLKSILRSQLPFMEVRSTFVVFSKTCRGPFINPVLSQLLFSVTAPSGVTSSVCLIVCFLKAVSSISCKITLQKNRRHDPLWQHFRNIWKRSPVYLPGPHASTSSEHSPLLNLLVSYCPLTRTLLPSHGPSLNLGPPYHAVPQTEAPGLCGAGFLFPRTTPMI